MSQYFLDHPTYLEVMMKKDFNRWPNSQQISWWSQSVHSCTGFCRVLRCEPSNDYSLFHLFKRSVCNVCMFSSSLCDILWQIRHITSTKHLWIFNLPSPQKFEQQYPNRAECQRRNARRWEHPKMYSPELYPGPLILPPSVEALPAVSRLWPSVIKKTLGSSFPWSCLPLSILSTHDRSWARDFERERWKASEKFLSYLANYVLVCAHHSQS